MRKEGERIVIEKGKERADEWVFEVSVGTHSFEVSVSKEYHERLTGGAISARNLVLYSFFFLLDRESSSSILRSFDLREIPAYFPEYEAAMEFLTKRKV